MQSKDLKTNSWNKYRCEITIKTKNDDLDYLIYPTFRNTNKLFVLSFKNGDDDPTRDYFDKYCMPLVQIKYFNTLIENEPFFDQPVRNKKLAYEKLVEKSINNYCKNIIRLFVLSKIL